MKITAVNKDGERFEGVISDLDSEPIGKLSDTYLPEREIKRMIDNLNISPEAKNLLEEISLSTIQVGKYLLNIGKRILGLICKLFKEYPKASFGVIIGVVISALISTVPVIGFLLGPFLPLIVAAFALVGAWDDIQDQQLKREIDKRIAEHFYLKTI